MHPLALDARTWPLYSSILAGGVALVLLLHPLFFPHRRKTDKAARVNCRRNAAEARKGADASDGDPVGRRRHPCSGSISETARAIVFHSAELAAIGAAGWLFIALAKFVSRFIEHRYTSGGEDSLAARRVRTQTQVIQRIAGIGNHYGNDRRDADDVSQRAPDRS